MISEALVQRLRLPRGPAAIAVFGVGGKKLSVAKGSVSLRVWPRANGPSMTVSALILPRLTAYAGVPTLQRSSWNHLRGLELADPEFEAGDSVEILLGADVYATILCTQSSSLEFENGNLGNQLRNVQHSGGYCLVQYPLRPARIELTLIHAASTPRCP